VIELDVKAPVKEQLLKAVGSLPPLSPVLKKVLDSLADEQVEFGQLAKVIETRGDARLR
jgi:HD-like signal output (HDOD) protein